MANRKPKPEDLGTGGAAQAATALSGRKSRIDDILNAAVGRAKAKKKSKKTSG